MKRSAIFLLAFALVVTAGVPAWAQGKGRGGGGGFGNGPGNMPPTTPGTGREERGQSGREMRTKELSKREALKETQRAPGKETASKLLTQNSKLSSKLQGLLPAGTNVQDAAKGFANLGQFVAAAHVSHNLGIPFDQLKARMLDGKSLGQAIHELKPSVNAREEAIKGNEQALKDMEESLSRGKSTAAGSGSAVAPR